MIFRLARRGYVSGMTVAGEALGTLIGFVLSTANIPRPTSQTTATSGWSQHLRDSTEARAEYR